MPRSAASACVLQSAISALGIRTWRERVMRRLVRCLALVAMAAVGAWSFAGGGNSAPAGPHYNLNIIGVANPKTSPMTDSSRHSIFVGLGDKDSKVTSRIYLTPGFFAVCDGNAFDPAFDCLDNQVQAQGAVFQLPCNTAAP